MSVEINQPAPEFSLEAENGATYKLESFKGMWLVLYFYPKDNTSGCTSEACDFRDNMETIAALGVKVIGVSPDNAKSHANFKEKHSLNFLLLSDVERNSLEAYEVWKEKSMYGKKYMGVERSTFIIAPDGTIRKIYRKVKVAGHVAEVIKDLKELMK